MGSLASHVWFSPVFARAPVYTGWCCVHGYLLCLPRFYFLIARRFHLCTSFTPGSFHCLPHRARTTWIWDAPHYRTPCTPHSRAWTSFTSSLFCPFFCASAGSRCCRFCARTSHRAHAQVLRAGHTPRYRTIRHFLHARFAFSLRGCLFTTATRTRATGHRSHCAGVRRHRIAAFCQHRLTTHTAFYLVGLPHTTAHTALCYHRSYLGFTLRLIYGRVHTAARTPACHFSPRLCASRIGHTSPTPGSGHGLPHISQHSTAPRSHLSTRTSHCARFLSPPFSQFYACLFSVYHLLRTAVRTPTPAPRVVHTDPARFRAARMHSLRLLDTLYSAVLTLVYPRTAHAYCHLLATFLFGPALTHPRAAAFAGFCGTLGSLPLPGSPRLHCTHAAPARRFGTLCLSDARRAHCTHAPFTDLCCLAAPLPVTAAPRALPHSSCLLAAALALGPRIHRATHSHNALMHTFGSSAHHTAGHRHGLLRTHTPPAVWFLRIAHSRRIFRFHYYAHFRYRSFAPYKVHGPYPLARYLRRAYTAFLRFYAFMRTTPLAVSVPA